MGFPAILTPPLPTLAYNHLTTLTTASRKMRDLLYVLATVVFFLVMVAYVRGCQRLGGLEDGEESPR